MVAKYQDEGGVYNVWSCICHTPSCQAIHGANERNYKQIKSWARALELGIKPCGICRPFDLREIGSEASPPSAAELLPLIETKVTTPTLDEQIAANERKIAELEKRMADEEIAAKDHRIAELQRQVADLEKLKASPSHIPAKVTRPDAVAQPEAPRGRSQEVADVTKWRRSLERALKLLDQTGNGILKESLAARIGRLSRAEVIPRPVAAMMRTITEMRNTVEHENKTLSHTENAAACAAWCAIQEWASKEGLQI